MSYQVEKNVFSHGFIYHNFSDSDDSDTDKDIEESCALMITVVGLTD